MNTNIKQEVMQLADASGDNEGIPLKDPSQSPSNMPSTIEVQPRKAEHSDTTDHLIFNKGYVRSRGSQVNSRGKSSFFDKFFEYVTKKQAEAEARNHLKEKEEPNPICIKTQSEGQVPDSPQCQARGDTKGMNLQDTSTSAGLASTQCPQEGRNDGECYIKQVTLIGEVERLFKGPVTPIQNTLSDNEVSDTDTSPKVCGKFQKNGSFHERVLTDITSSQQNVKPESKPVRMTFVRAGNSYVSSLCDGLYCDENELPEMEVHAGAMKHSSEGYKPFPCKHCDESFGAARGLTLHLQSMHPAENPYQCYICDKSFPRRSSRWNHMRTHAAYNLDKRPHCDKICANKKSVPRARQHAKEKPHECSVCGKMFAQASCVSTHMRTHTGEKPYKCQQCGKRFALKNTLNLHIRTHTGEKPYQCFVCNKWFSQSSSRNLHLRTHTKIKSYQCPLCFRRFGYKHTLNLHFETAHTLENS